MHAPPASRSPKNVINYFHFFTDLPVDRSFQQRYWALRLWTGYQLLVNPLQATRASARPVPWLGPCWRRHSPTRASRSLLDHGPADALGSLTAAEQIAGRRTDLEGAEAAHHVHLGPWPAQVWLEDRPVVNQLNRPLVMQLSQQRLLADALAMACGEPDPIR
jgi:hypothetical protein